MNLTRSTLVEFSSMILVLALSQNAWAFRLISYDGKPARWHKKNITYVLDQNGSQDFEDGCDSQGSCVSERQAIENAFQAWSQISGVDLSFEEKDPKNIGDTGYDKENSIVWVESDWRSQSFSPPSGALAVTISTYKISNNEIVDSDIHFNGEFFDWAVIDTPEEEAGYVVDIQNIATHEIGHFIGLDHSSEDFFETDSALLLATMFFASGAGETFRRSLKNDDNNAARSLYPYGNYDTPLVEAVSPSQIQLDDTTTATLKLLGQNFGETTSVMLAQTNGAEDLPAKIVSLSQNELEVSFDFYGLTEGEYDLVVFNTYDQFEHVENALLLSGNALIRKSELEDSSSGGGGCNVSVSNPLPQTLLLLLLIGILIGLRFQSFLVLDRIQHKRKR